MNEQIERDAKRLYQNWKIAEARARGGSISDDADEQATRDELVDFIEANGLNYSKYDPRNIEDKIHGRQLGDVILELHTHAEYEVTGVDVDDLGKPRYLVRRYGRENTEPRWRSADEFMRP